MNNSRIIELAVKSGLLNYVDNKTPHYFVDGNATVDNVNEFAESLLEDILNICNEGDKTQTTSNGVAILVQQRFGLNI